MLRTVKTFGNQVVKGLKELRQLVVRKTSGKSCIKAGDGFDFVEIDGVKLVPRFEQVDREFDAVYKKIHTVDSTCLHDNSEDTAYHVIATFKAFCSQYDYLKTCSSPHQSLNYVESSWNSTIAAVLLPPDIHPYAYENRRLTFTVKVSSRTGSTPSGIFHVSVRTYRELIEGEVVMVTGNHEIPTVKFGYYPYPTYKFVVLFEYSNTLDGMIEVLDFAMYYSGEKWPEYKYVSDWFTYGATSGIYSDIIVHTTVTPRLLATDIAANAQLRGTILPDTDDAYDLGSASYRMDDIYATNGTIQTSDERQKEDIKSLEDKHYELLMKLRPVSFRWKEKTRRHFGVVAQEMEKAIEEAGLTTEEVAALIKSEEGIYGIRPQELVPMLIQAVQQLDAEVRALKAR